MRINMNITIQDISGEIIFKEDLIDDPNDEKKAMFEALLPKEVLEFTVKFKPGAGSTLVTIEDDQKDSDKVEGIILTIKADIPEIKKVLKINIPNK